MIYAIIIVVVLLALYFVSTYNGLVKLRNMVKDQWSQIDVLKQLLMQEIKLLVLQQQKKK